MRLLAVLAALLAVLVLAAPTPALVPPPFTNCTALNERYPHGVGRLKARDRTTGDPVTTFKRSTKLYAKAMSKNRGLDRDKDGVACEQA
jgi:hypothetical protein